MQVSTSDFAALFVVAVCAGAFGAMLGLGGGIILVPALIQLMAVEPRAAVAASVVSVIATSSSAATTYLRDRYSNIRLAVTLEPLNVVGAIAGAVLAQALTGEAVAGLFAVLLAYAAYAIARPPMPSSMIAPAAGSDDLAGEYTDRADGSLVAYGVVRAADGRVASLGAGVVAAVLGVGGGIIMVPVLTSRMRVPLRAAIATSNFMIGVTAAATAIPYYASGAVRPYVAAPCALGVIVGARLGARLAQRLPARHLRLVFALVLLYTAYTMARRAHWW